MTVGRLPLDLGIFKSFGGKRLPGFRFYIFFPLVTRMRAVTEILLDQSNDEALSLSRN